MSERIKKEEYINEKLVFERFLPDEWVVIKDNEELKHGDILVQTEETGEEKFKKITSEYDNDFSHMKFRIYVGEDKTFGENEKGQVLRQGRVNKKMLNSEMISKNYVLAVLEKFNIIVEEEK